MINTPLVSDYIRKGEIHEIKPVMKRSRELDMQTFDQALFDLYENGEITYKDAIQHADSPNDLRLLIKLESRHSNHRADEADFSLLQEETAPTSSTQFR